MESRNRLTVIFALDVAVADSVLIGSVKVDRTARLRGVDSSIILEAIAKCVWSFDATAKFCDGSTEVELLDYTSGKKKWTRTLSASGLLCRFSDVPAYMHSFVQIEHENVDFPFTKILNELIREKYFVHAWMTKSEHEDWQNVRDVRQYEVSGIDHSHLPKISNGRPSPLDRIEIDISRNPGRRVLRKGYVEALGPKMWLGSRFWDLIGINKSETIKSSDLVVTTVIENNVLHIDASDVLDGDTRPTEAKESLRLLIFDKSTT
jgi:hypothetical protein